MRTIGVFTSGGDAPGMNACLRAVVRTAIYHDCRVMGIARGYEGMIDGEIVQMGPSSVSNIIQQGGTILKTAPLGTLPVSRGPRLGHPTVGPRGH